MTVTWRDYVHAVIDGKLGALEVRLDALDEARVIQIDELARRLDELNHAHAVAQTDRHIFATKDAVEQDKQVLAKWRDEVKETLASQKGQGLYIAALSSIVSSVVTGVLILLIGRMLGR